MRFLVDVASLDKGNLATLTVEAESWQRALQNARKLRGDESPMSGFSIELLNDGARAVDPSSRVRYEVRRTADDAPLSEGAEALVKKAPAASKRDVSKAAAPSSKDVSGKPRAPAQPTPSTPPRPTSSRPPAPAPAKVEEPARESWPVPQTIASRSHEPTADNPLTYREEALLVPPGTSEDVAAQVLLVQFLRVRKSIESSPPGKLVKLAAFDVRFEGRPPSPPLAALTWGDWRGAEPQVDFPRRARPAASAVAQAPAPALEPAPAPEPAPVPAPAPTPRAEGPEAAPVPAPAPAIPIDAPTVRALPETTIELAVPQSFPEPPPSSRAPAPAAGAPPPQPAAPPPAPAPPPAAPVAAPVEAMPVSNPPRRAAGGDLIADLFEAMHDLHFQRDAIEGAAFCLAQAMEKLPSRAGFVHFYDIDRREFVLASAAGAGAQTLLLQRNPEQEPVLLGAMRQRRPVISSAATAAGVPRFAALGVQGTVLTAPVMVAGRFLAAIELADPSDGEPFNDGDANALAYIAEQFAEYLSSHGIVLDAQRISQAPRPA